jgi:uncharacterized lipoprotein NlpE involved in copper resistance
MHMKKSILTLTALVCLLALTGCKDATKAQWNSMGQPHHVILYALNGSIIREWYATGNVNESGNFYWYFEDAITKNLAEVAGGNVVVEQVTQEQLTKGIARLTK